MHRIAILAVLAASLLLALPATAGAEAMKGINTHLLWSSSDSADRTLQLDWAADAKADIIRVDVGWSSLQETGPSTWSDWYLRKVDSIVAGAKARGVKLLLTLTWTPCWASSAPDSVKQNCDGAWWSRGVQYYAPTDNAAYGKALAFLVKRYGSDVAAWEVWNEPNQTAYFKAPDQAVAYAKLVNAAYPAAKAVDPSAFIVAGSLSASDVNFVDRLYAAGMGNNFDAFSIHPYSGEFSPLEPLAPQYAMYSYISGPPLVREALLRRGANVPLWLTEFGWSVNPRRDGEPWENGVSEATQAEYLKLAFQQADKWDYVQAAIWFNMRDTTSDKYDIWGNAGLHRYDNSVRPAFAAFREVAQAPAASEPAPSGPAPTEPAPTEPAPTEPAPAPTTSEPTTTETTQSTTTTTTTTEPTKSTKTKRGNGKPSAHTSSVLKCRTSKARRARKSKSRRKRCIVRRSTRRTARR